MKLRIFPIPFPHLPKNIPFLVGASPQADRHPISAQHRKASGSRKVKLPL